MSTPIKARCHRCGKEKPLGELNGYDPFTNDYLSAYCRSLARCNSYEARAITQCLAKHIPMERTK